MDKLFTIAGTAMINGVATLRFATGEIKVREGVLRRAGFTPVELRELPQPMSKADAIAWLNDQGITGMLPVKNAVAGRATRVAEAKAERDARRAEKRAAAETPAETTLTEDDAAFLAAQAAAAQQGADEAIAAAAEPTMSFAERIAAARAKKAAERAAAEPEMGVDAEREVSGVEG
jgi:hypothetical protein